MNLQPRGGSPQVDASPDRHDNVDDQTGTVDSPTFIAAHAATPHRVLVDKPALTDRVPARSSLRQDTMV